MAKRARRTKTSHPGVKLKQITHKSGGSTWVARFIDPDNGRETQESLTQYGLTSEAARIAWARQKSSSLVERKLELSRGAPRRTGSTTFQEAIDAYQTARTPEVEDATLQSYRKVGPKVIAWAERRGVRRVEDLTLALIVDFRTWLLAQPKQVAAKGGRPGEKVASDEKRAAAGLNSDLTTVRAMFNEWRRAGRLPLVSSDDIKDGLRRVGTERPRPGFLKAQAIGELLRAAVRHDSEVFELTREEKDQGRAGETARYEPIAPFLTACLLTGCRIGELLTLPWSAVDLDAQAGRGELIIAVTATKTKIERAVDLGVSPALKRLLGLLKLRAGDAPYVFGGAEPLPRHTADNARKRLTAQFGAPRFTWKKLRQTTGTFLTNAPGIYGAASAYRSARQLGHSVVVAEKHYVGLVHVDPSAKNLDEAMEITAELEKILEALEGTKPDAGAASTCA